MPAVVRDIAGDTLAVSTLPRRSFSGDTLADSELRAGVAVARVVADHARSLPLLRALTPYAVAYDDVGEALVPRMSST